MKWIIIGLVSLMLTFVDYKIGMESVRVVYGYTVYHLLTTIPFNIIYLCLIFLTELLILNSFIKIRRIFNIFRRRDKSPT
ncbi:hypothetical protein SULI_01335 [Saccharolobus solfataricus]|uniref:Membrane protein n=2 Tax=Saccharolobus solfataricus TaxID=2287 RepID=A0A157T403_SACSO|nr:hypothetical protein SULB_02955 [Saccharolobus solfataricus]AYN75739.1 hypothetical protein SULC_02960 [Saccharolobus solfataricus]AYP18574.1 hypothetical protein SULA_02960 [Saccharolobus solfataricus]AZF67213.1 hypothetical protein SULG_01335 [Saccharolobus solfataricus]AZF69833.1 hypothetical protein SULH_01335 [Saccharolobus solfataricus]